MRDSVVGISNDVVGRTSSVTGAALVSNDRITAATFRIDLTTITVNGKTESQFEKSLDTASCPSATITLTDPIKLNAAFTSGATTTLPATNRLTLHGISHSVTFTISIRRYGIEVQATGTIPVAFSRWDIEGPQNVGSLGSLANHGVAEFLLRLQRQ